MGEPLPPSAPPHARPGLYPAETDEDLVISPYASFTSLSEPSAPIICSWLDKLSPQGCVGATRQFMGYLWVL